MAVGTGAALIASAAISAAGSAGSAIASGKLNKKNRKWQDKNWERQQTQNMENWNAQNKYNEEMYNKYQSPEAQMRQLKEAGINPYLYYSQGAGNMPGVQADRMPDAGTGGTPNQFDSSQHISQGATGMANAFQNSLQYSMQKRAADSALLNDQVGRNATQAGTLSTLQGLQEQKLDILSKIENLDHNKKLNPIVRSKLQREYDYMLEENQRAWASLNNDTKRVKQGEQALENERARIVIERAKVRIQQQLADQDGQRIGNDIRRLTMDEQRSYTLNALTRSQNVQTKEATNKIVSEYFHELDKMQLTKTQRDHLIQSINLMEAQELKTYIDAGGSAADLINQFTPLPNGKTNGRKK